MKNGIFFGENRDNLGITWEPKTEPSLVCKRQISKRKKTTNPSGFEEFFAGFYRDWGFFSLLRREKCKSQISAYSKCYSFLLSLFIPVIWEFSVMLRFWAICRDTMVRLCVGRVSGVLWAHCRRMGTSEMGLWFLGQSGWKMESERWTSCFAYWAFY